VERGAVKVADARYVEITLEEMEAFLKRAFRALRPRRNKGRGGEVTFDLSLSDNHSILVRVYSSIYEGSGIGRGKGSDSIKVVMLTDKGKPLMPAAKIVMRTKNWRTAVQDRIEEYLETYESKVEYWKGRRLERNEGKVPVKEDALDEAIQDSLPPPSSGEQERLEPEQEEERVTPTRPSPAAPPSPKPGYAFEGAYRMLGNGSWGIQIWVEGKAGDEGIAATKGNKRTKVRLVEKVKSFPDKYRNNQPSELWTFEDVNASARGRGRWAEDLSGDDSVVDSVVERYLGRSV
jgi:hypothetical protein